MPSPGSDASHLLGLLVDGLGKHAGVLGIVVGQHAVAQVGNVLVGPEAGQHVPHA